MVVAWEPEQADSIIHIQPSTTCQPVLSQRLEPSAGEKSGRTDEVT